MSSKKGGSTRGYRVWDQAAEDALKAGVKKHGLGAWEHIRKDPQFAILRCDAHDRVASLQNTHVLF
jgi:hypothetical protein